MAKEMTVHIKFEIKMSDIENLLDSASRGAGYWAQSKLAYESEVKKILTGKYDADIVDLEDEDHETTYVLNLAKIKKGFKIMAVKEPEAFAEFLAGDGDDNTGDTFLQCALFGEVIYG